MATSYKPGECNELGHSWERDWYRGYTTLTGGCVFCGEQEIKRSETPAPEGPPRYHARGMFPEQDLLLESWGFHRMGNDPEGQESPSGGPKGEMGHSESFGHRRPVRRDPFGLIRKVYAHVEEDAHGRFGEEFNYPGLDGTSERMALGEHWDWEKSSCAGSLSSLVPEELEQMVVRVPERRDSLDRGILPWNALWELHEDVGGPLRLSRGNQGGFDDDQSDTDHSYLELFD